MGLASAFVQTSPPLKKGDTGSGGGTSVGGNAAITGGILIRVSIALAQGYPKYY